jgi:plasmid stabilization system protein ParE
MIERLPLRVTRTAARQIREAVEWWRINRRAAPGAVHQELERAFAIITAQPQVGSLAKSAKLQRVRRIFLPIVKYHLYYHVVSSPECVEVVAFWHVRRGDGPPI